MPRLWTPQNSYKPPIDARINPSHPMARNLKWAWLFNENKRQINTHVPGGVIGGVSDADNVWHSWSTGIYGPEMVYGGSSGLLRADGIGNCSTTKVSFIGIFTANSLSAHRFFICANDSATTGFRIKLIDGDYILSSIINDTSTNAYMAYSIYVGGTIFIGFTFDDSADQSIFYVYRYKGSYAGSWEVLTNSSDTRVMTLPTSGYVYLSSAYSGYSMDANNIFKAIWDGRILTQNEMIQMAFNPFDMWEPERRPRYKSTVTVTIPNMDKWFVSTSSPKLGKAEVVSY